MPQGNYFYLGKSFILRGGRTMYIGKGILFVLPTEKFVLLLTGNLFRGVLTRENIYFVVGGVHFWSNDFSISNLESWNTDR